MRSDACYHLKTFGGTRVYVAGDTEDIPEMQDLKDIDRFSACKSTLHDDGSLSGSCGTGDKT